MINQISSLCRTQAWRLALTRRSSRGFGGERSTALGCLEAAAGTLVGGKMDDTLEMRVKRDGGEFGGEKPELLSVTRGPARELGFGAPMLTLRECTGTGGVVDWDRFRGSGPPLVLAIVLEGNGRVNPVLGGGAPETPLFVGQHSLFHSRSSIRHGSKSGVRITSAVSSAAMHASPQYSPPTPPRVHVRTVNPCCRRAVKHVRSRFLQ